MYLKAYKASNIPIYLRDIFMVLTNEEADRILSGKEKAYTIDELVSLLGISKSTIERWRRDSQSQGLGLNLGSVVANNSVIGKTMRDRGYGLSNFNDVESTVPFPMPDFHIGRSPRWRHSTIRKWMVDSSR